MSANFQITSNGLSLTATTTSTAYSLASLQGSTPLTSKQDIMLYNSGSVPIYVRAGDSNVAATVLSMPILPGEKSAWDIGSSTHIAVITASGTSTMTYMLGKGF